MCDEFNNLYNFFNTYFFKINIADVATIIGVVIAAISILQIKKNNEEENNPFLSMHLYKETDNKGIVFIKIKNFGKTPAINVKIPEIITPKNTIPKITFPRTIPYLAPNQEIVSIYCIGTNIYNFDEQKGTVYYENLKHKKFTSEYVLDVGMFKGIYYTDTTIEKINKSLEKIAKRTQ